MLEHMHPALSRGVEALDATDMRDTLAALRLLNFSLVAECAGKKRPPALDTTLLKPLLPVRKSFGDAQRRSAAFAALALQDTATALAFIDAAPAKYNQPVLKFEFNIFELIRYLAAAIDQRRPSDWIEPAWLEYLEGFPLHLAAEAAEWPDLFNFARVLAQLRGDRIDGIADDLHARIARLAQASE
jgi:hypothetical protein